MMEESLKAICAEHCFTAVTVSHNLRTSYAFSVFVHRPDGGCGCGEGETIGAATEAAIADIRRRFPEDTAA